MAENKKTPTPSRTAQPQPKEPNIYRSIQPRQLSQAQLGALNKYMVVGSGTQKIFTPEFQERALAFRNKYFPERKDFKNYFFGLPDSQTWIKQEPRTKLPTQDASVIANEIQKEIDNQISDPEERGKVKFYLGGIKGASNFTDEAEKLCYSGNNYHPSSLRLKSGMIGGDAFDMPPERVPFTPEEYGLFEILHEMGHCGQDKNGFPNVSGKGIEADKFAALVIGQSKDYFPNLKEEHIIQLRAMSNIRDRFFQTSGLIGDHDTALALNIMRGQDMFGNADNHARSEDVVARIKDKLLERATQFNQLSSQELHRQLRAEFLNSPDADPINLGGRQQSSFLKAYPGISPYSGSGMTMYGKHIEDLQAAYQSYVKDGKIPSNSHPAIREAIEDALKMKQDSESELMAKGSLTKHRNIAFHMQEFSRTGAFKDDPDAQAFSKAYLDGIKTFYPSMSADIEKSFDAPKNTPTSKSSPAKKKAEIETPALTPPA